VVVVLVALRVKVAKKARRAVRKIRRSYRRGWSRSLANHQMAWFVALVGHALATERATQILQNASA